MTATASHTIIDLGPYYPHGSKAIAGRDTAQKIAQEQKFMHMIESGHALTVSVPDQHFVPLSFIEELLRPVALIKGYLAGESMTLKIDGQPADSAENEKLKIKTHNALYRVLGHA